jgi:hypothetical protein
MAKSKSTEAPAAVQEAPETTKEVDVKGADAVVEVVPQGEDASEAYNREQNEALMKAKLTGNRGVWVDPTRDQEPDIAPELGVAPHPELSNPRAPEGFYTGTNLDPASNPVLLPVEEKEKRAKAIEKAREEAKKAAVESDAEPGADADSPAQTDPGRSTGPLVGEGDARKTE